MEKSTHKIGTNRGRKRIWLDGKRLANHGFTGGQQFVLTIHEGWLVLDAMTAAEIQETLDFNNLVEGQQVRKITGRPDGKPIIDITGSTVSDTFGDISQVEVTFTKRQITIHPA